MGHWFPETVLDNQFFDELGIGSSAQWIDDRVGIRQRRSVLTREDIKSLRHGQTTREALVREGRIMTIAAMCREPWRTAKERSGLDERGGQVDQVICGTSVPDWDIPANACAVAGELGLAAAGFDVNSACSSFVVDLHVARGLLATRAASSVAVFNAERYTTRLDYTDRSSCVLFGDSASAAILETTAPQRRALELVDTVVRSDAAGYPHVRLPDGGTFSQNGAAVQKFAVTKTVAVTHEILERNELSVADLRYFIGHQANFRMLASACEKNGIEQHRHLWNVDTHGNQGATGASTVLSTHWDNYHSGDLVLVAVVGSGLTWGAALFRAI
jgi:3-oxoacyl-[acyl-carrier-protein] synthase-3